MSARLLLVEDDLGLAEAVRLGLEDEGWSVEHVADGSAAVKRALSGDVDLVILDIRLPGMNGLEVCRQIRKSSSLPILFLTARGTETDVVIGLEVGGDDYLPKPFGMRVLRARISALLRRASGSQEGERRIRAHDLTIMPERQVVLRGTETLHLTTSEFQLLLALARKPGRVFSREQLMAALWQTDRNTGSPPTVNVHMRNLRAKLGDDPEHPRYIASVRGVGYKLLED